MKRSPSAVSSMIGSLTLLAALAPGPQEPASTPAGHLRELAEAKAGVARKIADFYADPRLIAEAKSDILGSPGAEQLEYWTRRTVEARLDSAVDREARVKILAEDVERTKAIEARIKALADTDRGPAKIDTFKAEYYRLDAEYRLAKEKATP